MGLRARVPGRREIPLGGLAIAGEIRFWKDSKEHFSYSWFDMLARHLEKDAHQ